MYFVLVKKVGPGKYIEIPQYRTYRTEVIPKSGIPQFAVRYDTLPLDYSKVNV